MKKVIWSAVAIAIVATVLYVGVMNDWPWVAYVSAALGVILLVAIVIARLSISREFRRNLRERYVRSETERIVNSQAQEDVSNLRPPLP